MDIHLNDLRHSLELANLRSSALVMSVKGSKTVGVDDSMSED